MKMIAIENRSGDLVPRDSLVAEYEEIGLSNLHSNLAVLFLSTIIEKFGSISAAITSAENSGLIEEDDPHLQVLRRLHHRGYHIVVLSDGGDRTPLE